MKSIRLTAAIVLCIAATAAPSYATLTQASGNGFVGWNNLAINSIWHLSGYAYNTDTGAAQSAVASIPVDANAPNVWVTFYVRGNGQTFNCTQYAISTSTFATMSSSGTTSASGNTTIPTSLSTSSSNHMHGALCSIPKALGSNFARVYGATALF